LHSCGLKAPRKYCDPEQDGDTDSEDKEDNDSNDDDDDSNDAPGTEVTDEHANVNRQANIDEEILQVGDKTQV
jgi:hypothetical protein